MTTTIKELIESEIVDFFAGFGCPGEPETPEEMQHQLLSRVMPLLAEVGHVPMLSVIFKNGWPEPNSAAPIVGAPTLPDGTHEFCHGQPSALTAPEIVPDALRDEIIDLCADYEIGDTGAQEIWEACRAAILNGGKP